MVHRIYKVKQSTSKGIQNKRRQQPNQQGHQETSTVIKNSTIKMHAHNFYNKATLLSADETIKQYQGNTENALQEN